MIAPTPRHVADQLVVVVADGLRPDTLDAALAAGRVPALARLRAEGTSHVVTTVFPSVTGLAYTPLLLGRHPAPLGIPGLRWYDRTQRHVRFPGHARSYLGHGLRKLDGDLDASAPTMFELARPALGAFTMVARGLAQQERIGRGMRWALRTANTHFRGSAPGWLAIDRDVAAIVTRRLRAERPRFVLAAMMSIDKLSHAGGQGSAAVGDALDAVDAFIAAVRDDAERDGRWRGMRLWVVSDHGHSDVHRHEDLARRVEHAGYRVLAHPWTGRAGAAEVGVMVSGNAMAHVYLDLGVARRPGWPALSARWTALARELLALEATDLMLLPGPRGSCEVWSRARGSAVATWTGHAPLRVSYERRTGDPLGIGSDLHDAGDAEAYARTFATNYPDALRQIAHVADAPRTGDIILSAASGWDYRMRYEPIPHRSTHGALHRDHMLVPLLLDRAPARAPRRTVDVMPSALAALGIGIPDGVEGESFV
jgi:hypothetical protein